MNQIVHVSVTFAASGHSFSFSFAIFNIKKQPVENCPDYYCYKMKYSLNVQALCDYRGSFLDVDINWPGGVHYARFFANSMLNKQFTDKSLPYVYRTLLPGTDKIPPVILADPAYPLLPNVIK